MESYVYRTTPIDGKDKGQRMAMRCTEQEREEIKKKMEAQGYALVKQKICEGRWGYWWEKTGEFK